MRRLYKLSGEIESRPERLGVSVVLAFLVMLFINGFIGSMGGIPSFVAYFFVFYFIRSLMESKKFVLHRLPSTDRKKMSWFFVRYGGYYLLLWGILRIVMTVSRVTGWGNISGNSALAFIGEMLKAPMQEKTAYVSVGILMFSFVLSLFPLTVIQKKGQWLLYALVDFAGFAVVCLVTGVMCSLRAGNLANVRPTCLIEELLACRLDSTWKSVLVLAAMAIFTVLAGCFAFFFAVHCYTRQRQHPKNRENGSGVHINPAAVIGGIVAVTVVAAIILWMPENPKDGYGKVARFLTKDEELGPMEFGGRIYVPVDSSVQLSEDWVPQGYLAQQNENCDSRFYRMAVANLLYINKADPTGIVQVSGAKEQVYEPAVEIEEETEKDSVYVLWDEDWEKESAYSHEPTGYTVCNEDLMEGLRMQFPEAVVRASDFAEYDAYFTIRAYPSEDTILNKSARSGKWSGCILVKDGKFYFGNYDNQITGICLDQLREILGGNRR